jgi:1-deoxy-D-xylulose-5-phosphate synthase
VGQDGPTHHGLFDVSYLRHIPNIIVAAPKDEDELRHLLYSATLYNRPVAVRYPRGAGEGADTRGPLTEIPPGRAEVLKEGTDVTILALGSMVYPALEAAGCLDKDGIRAGVVNCRFVKPIDTEIILQLAASTGALVTVEENALQGGFGSSVLELLNENGVKCTVSRLGVPDKFVEHGGQEELRSALGLDANGITGAVKRLLGSAASKPEIAVT